MRNTFFKVAIAATAAMAFSVTAQAANIVTKQQELGTLTLPSSLIYGTTFGAGALPATDTFYEDYHFVIPDATFASLTATLGLGTLLNISNLSARLYTGGLDTTTVGAVLSPEQLLQKWSNTVIVGTGQQNVIDPITLGAGEYILEIRGNVTGSFGGSYVGVLNVSAVPEPETYALFVAGLAAIGMMLRRSRQQD